MNEIIKLLQKNIVDLHSKIESLKYTSHTIIYTILENNPEATTKSIENLKKTISAIEEFNPENEITISHLKETLHALQLASPPSPEEMRKRLYVVGKDEKKDE